MEGEGGILDIGGGPAVMVDDHHPGPGGEKLGDLGLLRAAGVHHHHQGILPREGLGLLGGDEDVFVQGRGGQGSGLGLGGVGGGGPDDPHGDPLLPGDGAHPGRGPQHVQVGELVAHDDDLAGAGQQLREGGGHDPALDLGAALGLLGPAADEEEVLAVFQHHLVAAPAQGHVQGQGGELLELPGVPGVPAYPHGEGGGHAVGAHDGPDLVQEGELPADEVLEPAGLQKTEVVLPAVPEEDAPGGSRPLHDALVDAA